MTTTTLRPTSTIVAPFSYTGETSAHAATDDDLDSSYATTRGAWAMLSFGTVSFGTSTLKSVRVRARVRATTGAPIVEANLGIATATAFTPIDTASIANWTPVPSSFETRTGPWTATAPTAAAFSGKVLAVNFGRLFDLGDSLNIDWAEFFADLIFVAAPTLTVAAVTPDPYTASSMVPVGWAASLDSDGGTATHYELKVFAASTWGPTFAGVDPDLVDSGACYETGIVTSSAASTLIGPLDSGDKFKVFVRVAQTVNGGLWWSDWATDIFDVDVETADVEAVDPVAVSSEGRIDITVSRVETSHAWQQIEIHRSIDGGATWTPVRGGNQVAASGNTFTLSDWEVPNGRETLFRARGTWYASGLPVTGPWVQSGVAIWWASTDVWLKDPMDPTKNRTVRMQAGPSLLRPRLQTIHELLSNGDPVRPIIRTGRLSAARGNIQLTTVSLDEIDPLLALLDAPVLLLQAPDGDPQTPDRCDPQTFGFGSRYIAPGEVTEGRFVATATVPSRTWSFPFVEVAAPADVPPPLTFTPPPTPLETLSTTVNVVTAVVDSVAVGIPSVTLWNHELLLSPSANAETTISQPYTGGRRYVLFVAQTRLDSVAPSVPVVSGFGATWTNITPTGLASPGLWDATAPSLRRLTVWTAVPSSSGTGAIAVQYTGETPADLDLAVVEITNGASIVQVIEGDASTTPGTLKEIGPFTGAQADHRAIQYVWANQNVAATSHLELSTDTGGDADWTTLDTTSTSASPTSTYIVGWLDANATDDVTPGWWENTSTPAAYAMAVLVAGGTGGGGGTLAKLVPASGAWFGATTSADGSSSESNPTGLAQWVAETGQRPHIISFYKSGTWSGFTAAELTMLDPAGDTHAIPLVHMKFNAGGATWAQVAAGTQDAAIDQFWTGVKNYPHPMFVSFYHEPEDNVGGTGMAASDFVAHWRRIIDRGVAAGVTNAVTVLQYMGYAGWAVDAAGSGFEALYPGDTYVDWIGWDPYTWTPTTDTLDECLNNTGGGPAGYTGFYNWATTHHPGVPLMIGETGTGMGTGYLTETQAATIVAQWESAITSFPAIRAYLWWNALGVRDYQIQGRTLLAPAVTSYLSIPHFTQDTDLAL